MERIILHADLNYFYAAVECRENPKLRDVPMAVGGDEQKRHGIVLAKNELARAYGVKTGEALWHARRKCPEITIVSPHFDKYARASHDAREIYGRYTDRVEPFGPDECWMDMSGCVDSYDKAKKVADNLRREMHEELGLTISVGVSFNKVFAKLASDYKKPDATTLIAPSRYREIVWELPVNALLYVGRATEKKLFNFGVHTIGDLAKCDRALLKRSLGKSGEMLWLYANGLDASPVKAMREQAKSIGNSTTLPRDITENKEVRVVLYALCEKVAARLRDNKLCCCAVQLSVRDRNFTDTEHQIPLSWPTDTSQEMFEAAWKLYSSNYKRCIPIRGLGVRAIRLENCAQEQLCLFSEDVKRGKHKRLEQTKDKLNDKYGADAIKRGLFLINPELLPGRGHKLHEDE